MRVLSALLACTLLASCVYNPDPNPPSVQSVPRSRYGAYIEVEMRSNETVRGELLAIDNGALYVRTAPTKIETLLLHRVRTADLWPYNSDWGFGVWGVLGTLGTISHGFVLIFSAPIWILTSSIVAGIESSHMHLEIPEDDLAELNKWARYPQGMPRNVAATAGSKKQKQEEAWLLTKQALQAARFGKCEFVVQLDPRVRALDNDVYQLTFLRDEAIRHCLSMPSLLAPPGLTPSTPGDAGVPLDAVP
jgi:hypothetical protein